MSPVVNIVCSHFPPHPGGVERFAAYQAECLANLGYRVNVITCDTERLGFASSERGFAVYRMASFSMLPNNRLPLPYSPFQWARTFSACFSRCDGATIIHTRYFPICLIAAVIARIARQKLILIDHSSGYITLGGPATQRIARLYEYAMTKCFKFLKPMVFGVSQASCEWVSKLGMTALGVYYNGVDTTLRSDTGLRDLTASTEAPIALSVGRLLKEKGFLAVIEAFEKFSNARPEWILVIIGSGELEGHVSLAAARNPKIRFLGRQPKDKVLDYMSRARVLIDASTYPEGLPTILLEAGLCALPVISTARGGAHEVVKHGNTGVVIKVATATAIQRALDYVADHPLEAQRLGWRLRSIVKQRFDFPTITRKFASEYLPMAC